MNASNYYNALLKYMNNGQHNISNGSVMMIEKFYESQVENIPSHANVVNSSLL